MKRFALLLACGTAFVSPALAADVVYDEPPAPAPMMAAAPQYNWSGFYVGGQAGVAFNRDSGAFSNPGGGFVGNNDDSNSGFIGGGHIGYDYQMGNFVVGAVADLNYIDAQANSRFTLPTGVGTTQSFGVDQDINYVGTVRAKAGYAMDRFMVYATGGLAYANIDNNYVGTGSYTNGAGTNYAVTARTDNDDFGYAVGGGFDVLATQNVSFGLEYLYTDLGKSNVNVNFTPAAGSPATATSFTSDSSNDLTYHSVMAKASYHFN